MDPGWTLKSEIPIKTSCFSYGFVRIVEQTIGNTTFFTSSGPQNRDPPQGRNRSEIDTEFFKSWHTCVPTGSIIPKPALKRNGKRVQLQDLLNKVWKLGCVQKRASQQLPLRWFKLKESTCECLLTLEIQWEQMQIHLTTRRCLTDQRKPR